MYCIGRLWQSEFNIACAVSRRIVDGQLYKQEPVVLIQKLIFVLVGIVRTYHEPDLIHTGEGEHVVSQDHVS